MGVDFKGGDQLRKAAANAKITERAKGYDVGFFKGATYPNGTPVAGVAAVLEFGSGRVPEYAFFRKANNEVTKELVRIIKSRTAGGEPVTQRLVGLLGAEHAASVQDMITEIRQPPNKPATIAKKGSSNPLIDTGVMRQSVTYAVR